MVFFILAGALLVLSFPPVHWWPLIIPGMALYFYRATNPARTRMEVWWGGFVAGAMLGLWLSYNGLSQIKLLQGAVVFSYLIHISPLPIAILFGATFGSVALLYRILLTRSTIFNALLGAALYTLGEIFQQFFWQGYYWGSFAHAFAPFPPVFIFAPLGGVFLVSFVVAWAACVAAETKQWSQLPFVAFILCTLFGILYICGLLISQPTPPIGSLRVATVQAIEKEFSFATSSAFLDGIIYDRLNEAGHSGADLVIYPYAPAQGALYQGPRPPQKVRYEQVVAPLSKLNSWISQAADQSNTAFVWQTIYDSVKDQFYETFKFYRSGSEVAEYRKQLLYPFTDYYPDWMRRLGIVQRSDSLTPGPAVDYTQVGQWRIGNLDCSEVNQPSLARREARVADFILSVGSDALFQNGAPAQYSLASARYRAAENRIPVVRAALRGPSAIINPDGSIGEYMQEGSSGILRGTVEFYATQQTLYNRLGDAPIYAIIALILLAALKTKFI